jgi:hypothetical protein
MNMKRLALPFLSVILLVPSNAWADTLVLKDGSEIKGEIISEVECHNFRLRHGIE